jgi:hypothetical protein
MPRFSIVMPTRNRAQLLRFALQSALDQPYDDLEILVSDNDSHDDTPAVAQRFRDPRVRYIRTPETLAMPDSWEFALAHARGDYVTFLCDDDAFTPRLVTAVDAAIRAHDVEVVCWRRQTYVHPSWYVPEQRNILQYVRTTGRVTLLDSRQALRALCRSMSAAQGSLGPLMLNSMCSRRLIETVRGRVGRFFLPPNPDYSTYLSVLALVNRYAFLDDALMLSGSGRESIGSSTTYKPGTETAKAFMQEFKGKPIINRMPLRALVPTNGIAESILEVRHALPDLLADIEPDWFHYYTACFHEMVLYAQNGSDMSADFAEFERVLAQQPAELQRRVQAATRFARPRVAVGRLARRLIYWRQPLLSQAMGFALWRVRRWLPSVPLRGEREGFTNILEASRRLDTLVARYDPRPS